MAIPPPPGPLPPPPPPMGGLKLGSKAAAGGDVRSALLQSIQKGTKLKKTTTVDKSGPALSGKVCDSTSTSSPTISPKRNFNNNSSTSNNNNTNSNNNNIGNGAPKLGGLFEGLSSMPKLKPVNGSRVTSSSPRSTNNDTTNDRSGSPPTAKTTATSSSTNNASSTNSCNNSSNGPMDFNTELTKHLTLKRQKQQQPQINATEENLKTNRGPPPQPPTGPKNFSTNTTGTAEKSKAKASSPTLSEASVGSGSSNNSAGTRMIGNSAAGSVRSKAANLNLNLGNNTSTVNSKSSQFSTTLKKTTTTTTLNNYNSQKNSAINTATKLTTTTANATISVKALAPNKSTLFGGGSGADSAGNNESNAYPLNKSPTPTPGVKPMPSHGKPNFAPKPPGLQQQISMINGQHQRPAVARHSSMRSPRSPPIAPGGGPVFPTQQHFGTLRTPLNLCQSQDSINSSLRTAPNPPIGRPTVAPPKPPTVKPPPPPTPARSISNSNLNAISSVPFAAVNSALINSSSTTANSSPAPTQPPSNSSSSNSVAALREQYRVGGSITSSTASTVSTSASTAPPPPPPSALTKTQSSSSSPLSGKSNIKPIILNGGPLNAPPLPPHRTCPAPPPPLRQTSNSGLNAMNAGPPVPPQRHSSIRASAPPTPPTFTGNQNAPNFGGTANANNSTTVSRLVIDLESRFGKRFHNVTEFPKPPPFVNIPKVYPSRTALRATNVNVNNNKNETAATARATNSTDNNNTSSSVSASTSFQTTKPLQPAFIPMKKNRAPLPPPQAQAGIAAATVTVIRQSSFLYGSGGVGAQQ